MEAVAKYFAIIDLRLLVVAGLLLLVCAVPFVELFAGLWRSHFKKD